MSRTLIFSSRVRHTEMPTNFHRSVKDVKASAGLGIIDVWEVAGDQREHVWLPLKCVGGWLALNFSGISVCGIRMRWKLMGLHQC
jgi:hypothetical protein